MPAWRGWNEADVRPVIPMTSSFTPINAPALTAVLLNGSEEPDAVHHASSVLKTATSDADGGKKTSKKSKKRASTDTKALSSQRLKINDASHTTAIPASNEPVETVEPVTRDSKRTTSRAKQGLTAKNNPKNAATTSSCGGDTDQLQTKSPQSVYTSATSMDMVHCSAPVTSMNVLSATLGHGATLYEGSYGAGTPRQMVDVPKPLMTTPQRSGCIPKVVREPRLSPVEEEDEFDLLLDQVAAQFDDSALALGDSPGLAISAVRSTQLPTPCLSDEPAPVSTRKQPARKAKKLPDDEIQTEEDFLMGAMSDEEAVEVDTIAPPRSPTPPARDRKQNMREVEHDEDYGGALLTDAEKKILHDLKVMKQNTVKTIVRKPFPGPIRDRSPIFGASNSAVLRTCFRNGEALNVGCQAAREGRTVLLELYARVVQSWREEKPSRHQHFVLHDLYHDNPPHMHGTFDLWDQSRLWELDSKAFLAGRPGGIMCRLIGRLKRDGQKWRLEILSIWGATWEDVERVANIYAKPGEEPWEFEDD